MIPVTDKGYRLLHEGCKALAQVESNGMRIDVDYLRRAIKRTGDKINELIERMKQDEVYKKWRRAYGAKTNLGSRQQLGKVLFNIMKFKHPEETNTGRYKTDASVLENVDSKFVRLLLKTEQLKKARSTYLRGILRETSDDGFLRPFFSLNLVQTFRGQSDHPNFQNIPMKDPFIKKLIRRAIISRMAHQLVEIDYKGAEICNATCYHQDPAMIRYIKNPKKDLHRDLAMDCYIIPKEQVSWDARDTSKNMFIFPQFYGDFYIQCAQNMWEALVRRKIKTVDGLNLIKHLKRKGINKLGACNFNEKPKAGTFEKHIKEVEDHFWNKRFKVYNQWKRDWYEDYLNKGWFVTLTGFRIEGLMKRNQVINYPVQGSAFHWLLWSLIRIQKLLKKYNMKTLIVGQIHDSIVADVFKRELRNFLEICKQVMTVDIREYWKWIIVPLTIEAEVAPVGGSWYEKEEVKI